MLKIINKIKSSFYLRTFIQAFLSLLSSFVFAIYNMYIGVKNASIFNGYFSIYYICLFINRVLIIIFEFNAYKKNSEKVRTIGFEITSFILLLLNFALIYPVVLIMSDKRDYNLGLSSAIISALFTFISIILSIINVNKALKNDNILVKQSRTVSINCAIASLLTLQDTLVSFGNNDVNQTIIIKYTSCLILIFLISMCIFSYFKNKRKHYYS